MLVLEQYGNAVEHAAYDRDHQENMLVRDVQAGEVLPYSIEEKLSAIKARKEATINAAYKLAAWKLLQIAEGKPIDGIRVEGHIGTWYVIDVDKRKIDGRFETLLLLEHEIYGGDTASVIVDSNYNLILDDVWNGFADYDETFCDD